MGFFCVDTQSRVRGSHGVWCRIGIDFGGPQLLVADEFDRTLPRIVALNKFAGEEYIVVFCSIYLSKLSIRITKG